MKSNLFLNFYHGTTEAQARNIREKGFIKGYLTDCSEQAEYYAQEAAYEALEKGVRTEPVVLVIAVNSAYLYVDTPSIEEPLTMVLEKHNLRSEDDFFDALEQDPFGWPETPDDWQRGLFLTGTVRFDGKGDVIGMPTRSTAKIGYSFFDVEYPELLAQEECE